jgi:hypothetical protein
MVQVLLEVTIPLSTTVNVSNQTLMFIYQKLKMKKRVKQEKASQETQILNDSFYLIFFDANTKLSHFKLAKI